MFVKKSTYDAAVGRAEMAESRAEREYRRANANADNFVDQGRELQWARAELNVANARTAEAQSRLARILAMETPGMAHVGKRMIRAARGEEA